MMLPELLLIQVAALAYGILTANSNFILCKYLQVNYVKMKMGLTSILKMMLQMLIQTVNGKSAIKKVTLVDGWTLIILKGNVIF